MEPSWSQAVGLFDKVRTLKNAITGGGAKVSLSAGRCERGQEFEISILVQVEDNDLDIDRVYVEIEGRESIEIPDVDVTYESDGDTDRVSETVTAEHQTSSQAITVAGEQTLAAGQAYDFTVRATLPADSLPAYRGKHCQHHYFVKAGIACFGNDPDTGWIELDVC